MSISHRRPDRAPHRSDEGKSFKSFHHILSFAATFAVQFVILILPFDQDEKAVIYMITAGSDSRRIRDDKIRGRPVYAEEGTMPYTIRLRAGPASAIRHSRRTPSFSQHPIDAEKWAGWHDESGKIS
jgi:hypothetical protein